MTTPKLEKARIWAGEIGRLEGLRPGPRAAVEVIQSLPDQWIDAKELRGIYDRYRASEITLHEAFHAAVALTTPPLPTLAELIEAGNDPKQYQWMQCNVEGRGDDTFVIAAVGERVSKVLLPDGMHEVKGNRQVTPLPDLPKLEWPGSHADTITAESVEDVQAGRVADFEPALPRPGDVKPGDYWLDSHMDDRPVTDLPRPEDVPSGEPWIVENHGFRWVGTREAEGNGPCMWALARSDSKFVDLVFDEHVTLISRLVPEVTP